MTYEEYAKEYRCHSQYDWILLLTEIINLLDSKLIESSYLINIRWELINHQTNNSVARLLTRGYLKGLQVGGLIDETTEQMYFTKIEDLFWEE